MKLRETGTYAFFFLDFLRAFFTPFFLAERRRRLRALPFQFFNNWQFMPDVNAWHIQIVRKWADGKVITWLESCGWRVVERGKLVIDAIAVSYLSANRNADPMDEKKLKTKPSRGKNCSHRHRARKSKTKVQFERDESWFKCWIKIWKVWRGGLEKGCFTNRSINPSACESIFQISNA